MTRKHLGITLAALLVVVLGIGLACAPAAEPTATPRPTATPAPTYTPIPTSTPVPGAIPTPIPAVILPPTAVPTIAPTPGRVVPSGTISIHQPSDVETMDPQVVTNSAGWGGAVMHSIYDTLVLRDEKLQTIPSLATSWETPDAKTWIFKLRKDVKFHNGEPFNAKAVEYTFKRMIDPATKSVQLPKRTINFDSTEIVDDYTIKVKTTGYAATMLPTLLSYSIIPPGFYGTTSLQDVTTKAVGSGAFKFQSWDRDDKITVTANESYWRAGSPRAKTVVWKIVPEISTALAASHTGLLDIVQGIPSDRSKEIAADTKLNLVEIASLDKAFLGLSTDRPYLKDKRVRQALAYSINRDAIIKSLLGGSATPMTSIVMGPDANPSVKGYSYDTAKAKDLLKAANWPAAQTLILGVPVGRYPRAEDISQVLAAGWTSIGVKTEVKRYDWGVFRDMWVGRKMDDVYYQSGFSSSLIPQSDLQIYAPGYVIEASHWDEFTTEGAEFAKLWNQLIVEPDPAKRKQVSFKMEELANDALPGIVMYTPNLIYAVNKRVDNWTARADKHIFVHTVGVK